MNHPLQCQCGTLKGYVSNPQRVNRCTCYCKDCQAFAHFLGRAAEILDAKGGTDVIQTLPAYVTFTQGQEVLACMRLTENGLLRWYAKCCNTPVGNTLANYRMSFVGLVHNCLENSDASLNDSFGPVRALVNTKGAKGEVRVSSITTLSGIFRFIAMVLRARISGNYKRTPFFSIDTGAPVAKPKVLSHSEWERVMKFV